MRPILILATLTVFGVLAWHALIVVAPRIEAGIDRAAEAAIAGQVHPLAVVTRGRNVTVSGLADSDAARDAIVAGLARLPGVASVDARISVLPRLDPYGFTARRMPGQPLKIEGAAPSATAESAILDRARTIATGHTLQSALVLAAGAPGPDWPVSVGRGLGALGLLVQGEIEIMGTQGTLRGRAADAATREAALGALAGDTLVQWQAAVELVLPRADPFRFEAQTTAGAAPRYAGNAPDAEVQARLAAAAGALGGGTGAGEITLAEGMPDPGWPDLVLRGLAGLDLLESGQLEVEGMSARLTGVAATPERAGDAAQAAGEAIAADIAIADPRPAARLAIDLPGADARPRLIAARLPEGLDRRGLARALPELALPDDVAIETGARGAAADWDGATAALAIALPRIERGRAEIEGTRMTIAGQLRPGFSAAAIRAALRSAAGPGWTFDLALDEAPQPPGITLRREQGQSMLSGILPTGLSPEAALDRVPGAGNGGLTSGGAGDPLDWRRALDALAAVAPAFVRLDADLAEGSIRLDGDLAPGHTASGVGTMLRETIGKGWEVELAAREATADQPSPALPQSAPLDAAPSANPAAPAPDLSQTPAGEGATASQAAPADAARPAAPDETAQAPAAPRPEAAPQGGPSLAPLPPRRPSTPPGAPPGTPRAPQPEISQ